MVLFVYVEGEEVQSALGTVRREYKWSNLAERLANELKFRLRIVGEKDTFLALRGIN